MYYKGDCSIRASRSHIFYMQWHFISFVPLGRAVYDGESSQPVDSSGRVRSLSRQFSQSQIQVESSHPVCSSAKAKLLTQLWLNCLLIKSVDSSARAKSLSTQFSQCQVTQYTIQQEPSQLVYSSARVKSPNRQFSQSQVTQQTAQLKSGQALDSSATVKSPSRWFS